MAAWVSWSFTGRTIVSVNQNEMNIQRRVLGFEWDTRRFATFEIRNLRYLPPTEIWTFRTDTDPNASKVQFQVKNKTVRFAGGITEREACALFDCLETICKFPKDSELDQVRAVR
jgi:extradiol dioxygenase family protein